MKTILKSMILLMMPFALISCSKDDDDKIVGGGKEAIIKVEVTNNGSSDYEESLNIQVVGGKMENTVVTGANWDEIETPHSTTKWFKKQGDVNPSIVYQTTEKVTALTYAVIISKKANATVPLVTTIKFYADGKLVKTETLTTLNEVSTASIPIVVAEL